MEALLSEAEKWCRLGNYNLVIDDTNYYWAPFALKLKTPRSLEVKERFESSVHVPDAVVDAVVDVARLATHHSLFW